MKKIFLKILIMSIFFLSFNSYTKAQTASINIGSKHQTITGFGGMNFPRWIADLSPAQTDLAFGNGSGQIGLSILRVSVSPNRNDWSMELATAQRAKSHGAIILGTPWSPPASMKTNNSTVKGELRTDQYGAYAQYLTDFTNYMSSNGASLYAISVQNEPDWLPDYESCDWSPTQIYNFVRYNAGSIPTRVLAAEALGFNKAYTDPILNDANARANLDIVGGHLYGTPPSDYPLAWSNGKEIWMTEHYIDSDVDANSWPNALQVGKEVNDCMVNNFNAYIWWYIRRSYGLISESGNVTKRGYVMSHFSKFVRPGFKRVSATVSPTSGVNMSAYSDGNKLVIVVVNQNSSTINVTYNISGGEVSSFTKYVTSSSNNVANVGTVSGGSSMTNYVAANSITTYVGTIGGGGSCNPTSITPYLQVDNGSWQQTSSVSISSGSQVRFGPQPASGGSWSWSGCGTSGSSREQTVSPTGSCTATATYTNSCGARSTQNFNITVSSSSSSSSSSSGFNGTYTFIAEHSGKALDISGGGTSNGTNVHQWSFSSSNNNQRFQITHLGDGFHRISPVIATSQAIDVEGVSSSDGANIHTWAYGGGENQQWAFISNGNSRFQIRARHSGKCIDVEGVSTDDGANIHQWTCISGAQNQLFELRSANSAGIEISSGNAEIFPNPAINGNFTINIEGEGNSYSLTIFSLEGKKVYEIDNLSSGVNEINSGLNKGIYIVNFNGINQKLVIE